MRSGNFAIPETGHTVVLGSGPKLVHVLRSILHARERQAAGAAFPGCIAVLSTQPKVGSQGKPRHASRQHSILQWQCACLYSPP